MACKRSAVRSRLAPPRFALRASRGAACRRKKFSQHAKEVLGEFGYSKGEIDALVAEGVVCGSEQKR